MSPGSIRGQATKSPNRTLVKAGQRSFGDLVACPRIGQMWRRIREIIVKEFRQTLREPRMRIFLFVPPMVQLILFGYAVNLDVEDSRIGWVDRDQTPAGRELRAAFEGSPYFRITQEPSSAGEAQELLDRGKVAAVVAVLPGFARDIERGETAARSS